MSHGGEFIASDVYTKHLLQKLRSELKEVVSEKDKRRWQLIHEVEKPLFSAKPVNHSLLATAPIGISGFEAAEVSTTEYDLIVIGSGVRPGRQPKIILRKNAISPMEIALGCGLSTYAHVSNMFRQIVRVRFSDDHRSYSPKAPKKSIFASRPLATPNIVLRRQNRPQRPCGYTAATVQSFLTRKPRRGRAGFVRSGQRPTSFRNI
jgi:hypothetical protein